MDAFQLDAFQNDAFQAYEGPFLAPLINQTAVAFTPSLVYSQEITVDLIDRTAVAHAPTQNTLATIALGLISQTASPFTPTLVYNQLPRFALLNQRAVPHAPTLAYDQALTLGLISRPALIFNPYAFLVPTNPEEPGPPGSGIAGAPSLVEIYVDGVDIASDVVITSATFTSMVNGQPGNCQFRVRDDAATHSFTVGAPIRLVINTENVWRGFVASARRSYAFAAEQTPAERFFIIDGFDINILFRKRIVFNRSNPRDLEGPRYTADNTPDIDAIEELVTNYLTLGDDGLNVTALVEEVGTVNVDHPTNPIQPMADWGNTMRVITSLTNAIYYIDPDKRFVHTDVDTANAPFELSDVPVGDQVGYREMEILHDGVGLINDALVWGTGIGGNGLVIAREEDATSIAAHGRWQYAEANSGIYKQSTANRRADALVDGSPQSKRGAKNDRISVACTVFEPGLRVADKVDFTSEIFGYTDVLPIRRMDVTFVNPSTPRYRLTLSHEIDFPWGFFDNYLYRYPPWQLPKIDGGGVIFDPWPPLQEEGECECGITDSFDRTEALTWGTSDAEIVWHPTLANFGVEGDYDLSVDGDAGLVEMIGNGSDSFSLLQQLRIPITGETSMRVRAKFASGSGEADYSPILNFYLSGLYWTSEDTGSLVEIATNTWTRLSVTPSGGDVNLLYNIRQPGPDFNGSGGTVAGIGTNDWFWVYMESNGSGFRARVWKDGDPEPASWNVDTHPTSGMLYITAGLDSLVFAGATDVHRFWYDSLEVQDIDRCTAVQFDDFNRVVASGWGVASGGSSWVDVTPASASSVGIDGGQVVLTTLDDAFMEVSGAGPWDTPTGWTMLALCRVNTMPGAGEHADFDFSMSGTSASVFVAASTDTDEALILLTDAEPVELGDLSGFASGQGFWIEWERVPGGISRARVWQVDEAKPDWQVETTAFDSSIATSMVVGRYNQSGSTRTLYNRSIEFDYEGKPCYVECPDPVVTFDAFDRTVASSGWGTSTDGHVWAYTNDLSFPSATTSTAYVEDDRGVVVLGHRISNGLADGVTIGTTTPTAFGSLTSWVLRSKFMISNSAATSPFFEFALNKSVGNIARVSFQYGTGVNKIVYGVSPNIGEIAFTWQYGVFYNFIFQHDFPTGKDRIKVWLEGDVEPLGWLVEPTTAQTSGLLGISVITTPSSSSTTDSSITFEYIDFYTTYERLCSDVPPVEIEGAPLSGWYCQEIDHTVGGSDFATERAFVGGTLQVYVNGLRVTSFTSDPALGEFHLTVAIDPDDVLSVCYEANGSSS